MNNNFQRLAGFFRGEIERRSAEVASDGEPEDFVDAFLRQRRLHCKDADDELWGSVELHVVSVMLIHG